MNKAKLLIVLILVSSIAFSQSATDTNKITLSYPVAKAVARDLISGDSAIATLKVKDQEIKLLEQKVSLKDSVIYTYRLKETNYLNQVNNEASKVESWQNQYSILQKDYKKLLVKHRFAKILAYAIVGGLGYLYITK
jgi:hypothetical protein